MLGTPASSLGPSAYPTKAPIVRFLSSSATGSACKTAHVALESVSLFGGVVTARSVAATHGQGTVSGFAIYGSPVTLRAGHAVRIGSWGEVTLEKTVGRLTAPLVVQLLAAHHGLPAGTTIAFAFGASPRPPTSPGRPSPLERRHADHGRTRPRARRGRRRSTTSTRGARCRSRSRRCRGSATSRRTTSSRSTAAPRTSTRTAQDRSDIYDGWHHGDDLFAPLGTPIVAVARGTLSLVGWNELGGWRLWLTDKKGNSFYYAHLAGYARWILTHPHVRAGQVIGFLGRTGDAFTTEPHLHFEVHPHQPAFVKLDYDGAVNPTTYLQKWKVEHVPADEIPQPARLKAPVGAPTQEAAVVWHQLLVARHLLGLTTPATLRLQHRARCSRASVRSPTR